MEKRLAAIHGVVPKGRSVRFVLSWETDENDVDFHITDHAGGHARYRQPHLDSGGDRYADVTTGVRSRVLRDRPALRGTL